MGAVAAYWPPELCNVTGLKDALKSSQVEEMWGVILDILPPKKSHFHESLEEY